MNIKITKELNRPDLGTIAPNSIANSNAVMREESLTVAFPMRLFTSQAAQDAKAPNVPGCTEFPNFRLFKVCTQAEWDAMNDDAGAGALVVGWFQDAIDNAIGLGNTEIVI